MNRSLVRSPWSIVAGASVLTAGVVMATGSAFDLHTVNLPDIALTSADNALDATGGIAFILGPTGIPTPSDGYVSTVDANYLTPLGFNGVAEALYTPENSGSTDVGLQDDLQYIMQAVHAQIATGDVSADNPIWLFGYSQSTAALALAAEQLHAEGVPTDDLHFVLVGDSASAHGGFLNSFMDSMPTWLQQWVEPYLGSFGIEDSVGLTTPDYYPTDVYTISDDGYANWPTDIFNFNEVTAAINGMFSSHTYYLGLDPDLIQNATLSYTDDLANYFTIDAGDINGWDALVNAGVNIGSIPDWLGDLLTGGL